MKYTRTFLAMLLVFILTACSYDDIVVDNTPEQMDAQRSQYIQSSYKKAYAKMRTLYPSTFANGKRMATGTPTVENSYPLWYSDTAITTVTPNPFAPDYPVEGDVATVANDSIYAYVFDFANGQGSMVVSVDDNLPDLLVYIKGRNFLKNPFKKFTSKQDDNDHKEFDHTLDSLYQIMYERREAMIREMLASLANATAGEISAIKADTKKLYEAQISADGSWSGLQIDTSYTTKDWYLENSAQYGSDGMVPLHWLNIHPFTSKIEQEYGVNAKCWDIIPTLAMYFATLRADVRSDDGWVMDWESVLNPASEADSAYNMNNIARLYYELGLSSNLNVQYYQNQTMEVKDKIPAVLSKFGIANIGKYETQNPPLWTIYNEIDNNRPAICLAKGLIYKNKKFDVLSFLADDYEIKSKEILYKYYNSPDVTKSYDEIFVSLKFQSFDAEYLLPDAFYNWALFDPNYAYVVKVIHDSYSQLPVPHAKTMYEEMCVLKTIQ